MVAKLILKTRFEESFDDIYVAKVLISKHFFSLTTRLLTQADILMYSLLKSFTLQVSRQMILRIFFFFFSLLPFCLFVCFDIKPSVNHLKRKNGQTVCFKEEIFLSLNTGQAHKVFSFPTRGSSA